MTKKTAFTILTLIVLVLAIGLFFIFGGAKLLSGNKDDDKSHVNDTFESSSGLYINEVVSKSNASLVLSDGSAPDWIEIYNDSSRNISLSGMGLSDDNQSVKYTFPGVSVGPGEYIIVLLTGEEGKSEEGLLSAGFRLGADSGETVYLLDAAARVVQSVEVPELFPDISYGRAEDGTYKYFAKTTPGANNSEYSCNTPDFTDVVFTPDKVIINEYQLNNRSTLRDGDGEYSEWVEIKNISDESIDLLGYALADKMTDLGKWKFDSYVMEPGECLVIFLSGKDRKTDELHADFRINTEENIIVLTGPDGGVIDTAVLKDYESMTSVGRDAADVSEWRFYPSPTPGKNNTTKGFTTLYAIE